MVTLRGESGLWVERDSAGALRCWQCPYLHGGIGHSCSLYVNSMSCTFVLCLFFHACRNHRKKANKARTTKILMPGPHPRPNKQNLWAERVAFAFFKTLPGCFKTLTWALRSIGTMGKGSTSSPVRELKFHLISVTLSTSLCLGFLSCKMGAITVFLSKLWGLQMPIPMKGLECFLAHFKCPVGIRLLSL